MMIFLKNHYITSTKLITFKKVRRCT